MKNILPIRAVAIGCFAMLISYAAIYGQSTTHKYDVSQAPNFDGKFIILNVQNWDLGVRENVRFTTIGDRGFAVVPMPMAHDAKKTYDVFIPLSNIASIETFANKDDAMDHRKAAMQPNSSP